MEELKVNEKSLTQQSPNMKLLSSYKARNTFKQNFKKKGLTEGKFPPRHIKVVANPSVNSPTRTKERTSQKKEQKQFELRISRECKVDTNPLVS